MKVDVKYESPLVMKNMRILHGEFKINKQFDPDYTLKMKIRREISKTGPDSYDVTLSVDLYDNSKILVERNAISIMFPYLRSYITTLTSVPGMQPIVLPPINIAAMLEDEQMTDDIEETEESNK